MQIQTDPPKDSVRISGQTRPVHVRRQTKCIFGGRGRVARARRVRDSHHRSLTPALCFATRFALSLSPRGRCKLNYFCRCRRLEGKIITATRRRLLRLERLLPCETVRHRRGFSYCLRRTEEMLVERHSEKPWPPPNETFIRSTILSLYNKHF